MNVTGISTLQNDVLIGSGVTLSPDGDGFFTGVVTATSYAVGSGITLSSDGDGFYTGVVTATSFVGDISNTTGINTANVRTGILDVAGIATFRGDTLVGSGVTLNTDGHGFFTGIVTATFRGDGHGLTGLAATDNVRTNTNATFLQNVNVSGSTTTGSIIVGSGVTLSSDGDGFYTGVVTATSFVGDGANLTGVANTGQILSETLTVSIGATIGIASFSSSGIVTTTDAVGVVTYYGDVSNAAHQRWYLGANGNNDYTFVGNGCTITRHDPPLFLARGNVYEFVNNMGAHGFRIQMVYQNINGQLFPHGVTNNEATTGTIRFEVPLDAPNTLYYQCAAHSGMAGTMNIYPSL